MIVGLVIVLMALAVFEIVAVRFGVDSRDGDDWFYRRHDHPGGARRMPD